MQIGTSIEGECIDIPANAISTAGTSVLAMRGAGKSWLTALIAEGLSSEKLPYVIIDPEGEYWTLKVKFPDVIIAGGPHSDVPIQPEIAAALASAVVEHQLEIIIDLSDTRRNDQFDFVSIFISELFAKETESRIPLWVCFEEADLWVPQIGNPACKTAILDLCQRGRKRGLGFALVSQRPATLDKTALSQAEFRFFKRFNQPQDLRAVSDYFGSYANRAELLPSLDSSEALLYAPTLWDEPIRFTVGPRITPHGGATPDQVATIKTTASAINLRKDLERLLENKRKELSEIQQEKAKVQQLAKKIKSLEEELEHSRVASRVAEILAESTIGLPHLRETDQKLDSVSIIQPIGDGEESEQLSDESIIPLGFIGMDIRSGQVLGGPMARTLLNRLNSLERVTFLSLWKSQMPMSSREISEFSGISTIRIRQTLKQLSKKGLIRSKGRTKRGMMYTLNWNQS